MINRVDNRSMMQCLLKCNELLKQVRCPRMPQWQCRRLRAGHIRQNVPLLSVLDKSARIIWLLSCMCVLNGQGASVLFFPEGTRSKDGKMAAFKKVRCFPSACSGL